MRKAIRCLGYPLLFATLFSAFSLSSKAHFDDKIMITPYWPPTLGNVTDDEYARLAKAGFNCVLGISDGVCTPSTQKEMLNFCKKYQLPMLVADERLVYSPMTLHTSDIQAIVKEYTSHTSTYGFYIKDEPTYPNDFINVCKAIKSADPDAWLHLNFLPGFAYQSADEYVAIVEDWVRICRANNIPVDCLIFDMYPFQKKEYSMDRNTFLTNLEQFRQIGLRNGVKTGTYLQSCRLDQADRYPNEIELQYELNLALAYGNKQISHFLYATPINPGNTIGGMIAADGTATETYQVVTKLNKIIDAWSNTLVFCDALEVYFNGGKYGQTNIPSGFPVQATDRTDFCVSRLYNAKTGKNYLMIVNNDLQNSVSFTLSLDASISSLQMISCTDGKLYDVTADGCKLPEMNARDVIFSGNQLRLTMDEGEAYLFALPDQYSRTTPTTQKNTKNLAANAYITCDSSLGRDGWYITNLNDGIRTYTQKNYGWHTNGTDQATITLAFPQATTFNRIDLYPAGDRASRTSSLPASFTVSISSDGINYTEIKSINNYQLENGIAPSVTFSDTTARYLRISVKKSADGQFTALSEIEVYYDDGSIAAPVADPFANEKVISYTKDNNIALNKSVFYSSSTSLDSYGVTRWSANYLTDGKADTAWTSARYETSTPVSFGVDLGDTFSLSSISLTPYEGMFPTALTIEGSADGLHWTTLSSVASLASDRTTPYSPSISYKEGVRYLRFTSNKLPADAFSYYYIRVAEIEVYGTPFIDAQLKNDIEELNAKIDAVYQGKFSTSEEKDLESLGKRIVQMSENGVATASQVREEYNRLLALFEKLNTSSTITEASDTTNVNEPDTTTKPADTEKPTETTKSESTTESSDSEQTSDTAKPSDTKQTSDTAKTSDTEQPNDTNHQNAAISDIFRFLKWLHKPRYNPITSILRMLMRLH